MQRCAGSAPVRLAAVLNRMPRSAVSTPGLVSATAAHSLPPCHRSNFEYNHCPHLPASGLLAMLHHVGSSLPFNTSPGGQPGPSAIPSARQLHTSLAVAKKRRGGGEDATATVTARSSASSSGNDRNGDGGGGGDSKGGGNATLETWDGRVPRQHIVVSASRSSGKSWKPAFLHLSYSLYCRAAADMHTITISLPIVKGAGGQNVNKVSTKAELRFKVDEAFWLYVVAYTCCGVLSSTRMPCLAVTHRRPVLHPHTFYFPLIALFPHSVLMMALDLNLHKGLNTDVAGSRF